MKEVDCKWCDFHKGIKTDIDKEIVNFVMEDKRVIEMMEKAGYCEDGQIRSVITNILLSIKKIKRGNLYTYSVKLDIGGDKEIKFNKSIPCKEYDAMMERSKL